MKKLLMLLVVLTTAVFAKVKPEEFTLTANVTAVKSHDETTGMRNQAPMNTGNASFDKAYNAAGTYSTVETDRVFVMATEIGDRVYELEGHRRLELGTYQAKRAPRGFHFLYTDKDGKEVSTRLLRIVGERMKEAK
jgi:hypothetical protein